MRVLYYIALAIIVLMFLMVVYSQGVTFHVW